MKYLILILKEIKDTIFALFRKKVEINPRRFSNTYAGDYHAKIDDWIKREKGKTSTNIYSVKKISKNKMIEIARRINRHVNLEIRYEPDIIGWGERDYWETSRETLDRGRADCEGQAILKYALLRKEGISNDHIGIVIVSGHAFACLYINLKDRDFYVLDNGSITSAMLKASKCLDKNEPIAGFNLTKKWSYGGT